ncbi:Lrp/AsnC family transcriptional regulator [Telmatospirillum sp.]|uniref:Lrp/AsnC family transcriptional regulator n=1 Tax=Telmatospirillum sp. TaxID=2079197 RepID=UPI00283C7732|nr:Lrp/AsnC family transcriptional regulator [Telmatospirillum sp.]MDR3436770.1 Lrp/AsnC family transcriptional regulator [Telmatospirillum sp.]
MPKQAIEAPDARILSALQQDGRLTNQDLAQRVGLSTSPCWRRVHQMEDAGLIQGYRAILDRQKIGLGVLAFVRVKIDSHSEDEARKFEIDVQRLDRVIACYSIAGSADFLLQVVARDLDDYADFAMAVIRRLPRIKEMETSFVLKEVKPLSGLPIEASS